MGKDLEKGEGSVLRKKRNWKQGRMDDILRELEFWTRDDFVSFLQRHGRSEKEQKDLRGVSSLKLPAIDPTVQYLLTPLRRSSDIELASLATKCLPGWFCSIEEQESGRVQPSSIQRNHLLHALVTTSIPASVVKDEFLCV